MTEQDLIPIVIAAATFHQLDPALICAMCCHESSWNPDAVRYEPAFFTRYIKPMVNPVTGLIKGYPSSLEAQLRSTSIGLMQIMGQTAREQGFAGDLELLKLPENGVAEGCVKFARCLKVKGNNHDALLMYNGGGAPEYPDLVLQFYDKYKQLLGLGSAT